MSDVIARRTRSTAQRQRNQRATVETGLIRQLFRREMGGHFSETGLVHQLFPQEARKATKNLARLICKCEFIHPAREALMCQVIGVLVGYGANVNAVDVHGISILMLAATKANIFAGQKTARCLLEHGATVDAADAHGRTALMVACINRLEAMVRVLIEHGANVNVAFSADNVYDEGVTALMVASHKGESEIVRVLLENGANVRAADKQGRTALWWAGQGMMIFPESGERIVRMLQAAHSIQ